jgi:iron complex transport system permease protein
VRGRARLRLVLALLVLLAAAGFLLSLLVGPAGTSAEDLWRFLAGRNQEQAVIFLDLRLARAVLAFLVGASLALSGAILQGYFQNPMADPFVVGVSSGASLGAVLAIALGLRASFLGFSEQGLLAFASGLGIVALVYALSQRKGLFKIETLLLTGIAAGALASALTSFFLFMRSDSFDQAVFWLLGSFQLAGWKEVWAVAPWFAVCLAVSLWLAKDMNLLVLGDEAAQALGCPVRRVRRAFLVIASLLASLSVSVSGIIGFVGLVVPHGIRLLIGPNHRRLFPCAALAGGTFLLYSDLVARTILPSELPIGVITAAVGAPFFLYLLHQKR